MTAKEIELAVAEMFGIRKNLIVPNVWWGFGLNYEADLVVVSKAGYAKEIEIKVNKADLIKDKDKKHAHRCTKFRQLYFALPDKLLPFIEHVPLKAGIIIVRDMGKSKYEAKIERKAVVSSTAPELTLQERYALARLGTLRVWTLKRQLLV